MSFLIHRIRLENVRGIGEVEVGLQSKGVTVIQAPNETGKSTLFDAVRILRDYKSSSNAGPVKGLQPVGKDVGSLIEADLTIGPYRLTYTKRFNRERLTELRIQSPQVEQLTGDDAHNRVEELFATHVDTVLLNSLWIEQGDGLNAVTLDRSSAIAAALGADPESIEGESFNNVADPHGPGGNDADTTDESLLERVEQEFLQYFTQTGKDGKALKQVEQDVVDATNVVAEVQRKVNEIESLANQQVQVNREIERAESSLADITTNTDDLSEQMKQITEHRDQYKQLRQDLSIENERLETVRTKTKQRTEWLKQLEELAKDHAEIQVKVIAQTDQVNDQKAQVETLKVERAALSETAKTARTEREQAERAVQVISTQRGLISARSRVNKLATADQRKSDAQAVIDANPVTPKQIKTIQQAQHDLSVAQAQLKMAAPTVTLAALADVAVSIDGEPLDLGAGATEEYHASQPLHLQIAGHIDIEVRPGSSLDELQGALETAQGAYESALQTSGVDSLVAAEESLQRKQGAESALTAAQQAIESLLEGDSRDDLHERVSQFAAELRAFGVSDVDATTQDFDVDESATEQQLARARSKESETSDAHHEVQAKLDAVQAKLTIEQAALSELVSAEAVLISQHGQITASLTQARTESTDAELAAELDQRTEQCGATRAALKRIDEQLTTLHAESVDVLYDNAKQKLGDAERRRKELNDSLIEVTAKLNALGGTGLAEELADVTADLVYKQQSERQMKRRADAVRLLKEHLEAARAEVFDAYRAPLRNRINALGRVVFDPSFDVEIDDAFAVTRRTLAGDTLDRAALSSGAKEQLSVLTAVAAAQLASDGGVPLILDDSLGFSDPERMERVGAVLSRVTDAQVIVLTCVPARFETIGGAHRVELRPTTNHV